MQLQFSTWMQYVCTLKKPNRLFLTILPRPHPNFTLATLSLENSGENKSKKYQIITVWKVCRILINILQCLNQKRKSKIW